MLAPIAWRTPPRHYGPWELVTSLLTEELVKIGLDVTLFATRDSITQAKLQSVSDKGYEENPEMDAKVWECLHISSCFEQAEQFDIIHNQFDFLPLSYSRLVKTPIVTTIHGFSSSKILPVYKKYNQESYYVSISNADRSPELDYIATIHHGIDVDGFDFCAKPKENYLLYFGRIHPDKGTREAIDIARGMNKRLIIAGIIQDEAYFNQFVKPNIDNHNVIYMDSVGGDKKNILLGNATAMLHPINFREPFGLSVVESMACGTPVIAFRKGSMSELIVHGKTGFLVNNIDEAVAVGKFVSDINRNDCRVRVEQHFSKQKMAMEYLKVYRKILGI